MNDRNSHFYRLPEGGTEYPATGEIIENQSLRIAGHMPVIESPRYIHVAANHIRINNWVMPYSSVTRTSLENFQKSMKLWVKKLKGESIEEMLDGVVDQFEVRLSNWKT